MGWNFQNDQTFEIFSIFSESGSRSMSHPAEVERGAESAVYCGYLHTSVGASGLAASSPLTWHAVLRLPWAGRDHVEDLGGSLI